MKTLFFLCFVLFVNHGIATTDENVNNVAGAHPDWFFPLHPFFPPFHRIPFFPNPYFGGWPFPPYNGGGSTPPSPPSPPKTPPSPPKKSPPAANTDLAAYQKYMESMNKESAGAGANPDWFFPLHPLFPPFPFHPFPLPHWPFPPFNPFHPPSPPSTPSPTPPSPPSPPKGPPPSPPKSPPKA
ncbi:hypothetical protein ACH5RR_007131 [Cinchona calisaya]|uniref:Uncharacterized protein n=1 Tax=Cinchona calisaya TaxID=153742 RepID=A0ABD3AQZ1_9GENT